MGFFQLQGNDGYILIQNGYCAIVSTIYGDMKHRLGSRANVTFASSFIFSYANPTNSMRWPAF